MSERPAPPPGARNLVMVILDSLRYDSWVEAQPAVLGTLGKVERRFSYASWTAPSHYNLLMGLLPHTNPVEVYASEYYKEDFFNFNRRLGATGIDFAAMVPGLWMPGGAAKQKGREMLSSLPAPGYLQHYPSPDVDHVFLLRIDGNELCEIQRGYRENMSLHLTKEGIMNELPAENSQSLRPELMESFEEWNQTAGAWPLKRLVAMWNDLPGVTPVQKFTSREVALQRIWRFRYAPEQTTQRKEKESRVGSRFGKARKRPRCMPCCAVRKEQRLARSGN
jgi:hypothetical protein